MNYIEPITRAFKRSSSDIPSFGKVKVAKVGKAITLTIEGSLMVEMVPR